MRLSSIVPALILLAASTTALAALPSQAPPALYVPGEVIVKYRDAGPVAAGTGTGGSTAGKPSIVHPRDRLRGMGLSVRRQLLDGRADLMALPAPMDVPGALRMLAGDPDVEYAEPNYLRFTMQTAPNDSLFGDQWGLRNTGQDNFACSPGPGCPVSVVGADLNMLPAWDPLGNGSFTRTGDSSVIVAIIDDAFDLDHPDLAGNFIAGRDLVNNDSNPSPDNSDQSHGTLVAGSVGARGNNSIGVAGTTWFSSLMPLKVGSGDGLSSAAISDAIIHARENNADIINASFGGPGFSTFERDLICNLDDDDILFVSSAGNDDANMDFGRLGYPALYDCPNVVAVAATNRQDNIASFSMYGPVSVDVAAPGLQIVTTQSDGGYFTRQEGGVAGTSFSSPYTAGIAALAHAHAATATPRWREIKARLIESGTSLGNADRRVAGGRIDAAAALDMAPGPSLTIDEITIDGDTIPHPLRPGESDTVQITLANGWENASNVSGTLSSDNPLVTIVDGQENFGFIGADQQASATFDIQVSAPGNGRHNYVTFTLDITADGYSASRHFVREIAPLAHDGAKISQPFQTDNDSSATLESGLYDEYHTWHVAVAPGDLPNPNGSNTLVVRTETPNDTDIDLLGRANQPPQYLITLNVDPNIPNARSFFCTDNSSDCRDPNTRVSGRSDGHEAVTHVFNAGAAPEDFYFTIVNFAQASFDYDIWAELKAGDLRPSGICPSGVELCRPSSNTLTVSGLSTGAETHVYIRRGQYCVDTAYTSTESTVSNGDTILVRATGTSDAELTVGGITARFDPGSAPDSDDLCDSPPDDSPPDDSPPDSGGGGSSDGGGGGGGGCGWIGPGGKPDFLLHLLVLIASLVLLRTPLSF